MKKLLVTAWLCCMSMGNIAQAVPAIESTTLDNGLRILLIEAHNVPMVSMQLSLPAGGHFDMADKAGTAQMLASMLSDHTAQHDDQAWANWLDSEAIQLGAAASTDTLNLSLTVVKETLPTGLDAFAEALLQPGWRHARFASLLEDEIASAVKSQESPQVQASHATSKLLYGEHAYGHSTSGTAETLPHIQLSDLQTLYQNQCRPIGSTLTVSGDITMPELIKLLQPRLTTWQGEPKIAALDVAKPTQQKAQHRSVEMPTTQTLVQFSRLGIQRASSDFFPLFVMNHYLGGGGFGSKLMEEVREKRGLVYGVYSYFSPLAATGPFVITLQTRASQAAEAETVVRQVMQEMAAGNIDAKRLQASKDNLTGGFAQRMDSNRERVGLLSMIAFYQMPLDYLQRWTQQVDSVTVADVQRMAKQYLQPEEWNILQVGPSLTPTSKQPQTNPQSPTE